MVLPSQREGYGLIVVEAAAAGTPSVVVRGEDNAAIELIDEGVNGFVAPSASPEDLADGDRARALAGGIELRRSTADWFAANARRLSLDSSLERVSRAYAGALSRRARGCATSRSRCETTRRNARRRARSAPRVSR